MKTALSGRSAVLSLAMTAAYLMWLSSIVPSPAKAGDGTERSDEHKSSSCQTLVLSEKHSRVFIGTLSFKIFAGPPNFHDVRQGDQPEPGYILSLDNPVCAISSQFAPLGPAQEIELYALDSDLNAELRKNTNRHVRVTIEDVDGAFTGHHHAALISSVSNIAPDSIGVPDGETPGATTVRGFYLALEAGNGDEASRFVIPEKQTGPLSPTALSGFYGALASPLKLQDVRPLRANLFEATYSFRSSRQNVCDGRSVISVIDRNGQYLISKILSRSGC